MIIMIFTGIAVDYWSPLGYTFAMACPVFAFLFSFSSKYASDKSAKHKIFDVFIVNDVSNVLIYLLLDTYAD